MWGSAQELIFLVLVVGSLLLFLVVTVLLSGCYSVFFCFFYSVLSGVYSVCSACYSVFLVVTVFFSGGYSVFFCLLQ